MPEGDYHPGDRVEIRLENEFWGNAGWLPGTVLRVEPYSQRRSFTWVQVDPQAAQQAFGRALGPISVLNPKNIQQLKTWVRRISCDAPTVMVKCRIPHHAL